VFAEANHALSPIKTMDYIEAIQAACEFDELFVVLK
jgi:hypothetical protein